MENRPFANISTPSVLALPCSPVAAHHRPTDALRCAIRLPRKSHRKHRCVTRSPAEILRSHFFSIMVARIGSMPACLTLLRKDEGDLGVWC